MANATTTSGTTSSSEGKSPGTTKATLGLTGLTSNAMALIAPGAFLWLTFQMQSLYGAPMAGCAMWFGIVAALLLCFATAISYAEISKLFPGAGSSYLYAEQAFLSTRAAWRQSPSPDEELWSPGKLRLFGVPWLRAKLQVSAPRFNPNPQLSTSSPHGSAPDPAPRIPRPSPSRFSLFFLL